MERVEAFSASAASAFMATSISASPAMKTTTAAAAGRVEATIGIMGRAAAMMIAETSMTGRAPNMLMSLPLRSRFPTADMPPTRRIIPISDSLIARFAIKTGTITAQSPAAMPFARKIAEMAARRRPAFTEMACEADGVLP